MAKFGWSRTLGFGIKGGEIFSDVYVTKGLHMNSALVIWLNCEWITINQKCEKRYIRYMEIRRLYALISTIFSIRLEYIIIK